MTSHHHPEPVIESEQIIFVTAKEKSEILSEIILGILI